MPGESESEQFSGPDAGRADRLCAEPGEPAILRGRWRRLSFFHRLDRASVEVLGTEGAHGGVATTTVVNPRSAPRWGSWAAFNGFDADVRWA